MEVKSLGKQVKEFDRAVQDSYDAIQARRSELSVRLASVKDDISQVKINRAAFIAEGCNDSQEFDLRLIELRSEQEGLQDAIDHLSHEAQRIKRINSWIQ